LEHDIDRVEDAADDKASKSLGERVALGESILLDEVV
jgi:hypothetical protein